MNDIEQNKTQPIPPKRTSLFTTMIVGALGGAAMVIGVKLGWQKAVSWAKGIKPEYAIGDIPLYGALGGIIGAANSHEIIAQKDRETLVKSNLELQHNIELLQLEKKYTEKLAAEKEAKPSVSFKPFG